MIVEVIKNINDAIYWNSPYRWLDSYQKKLQNKATDENVKTKIQNRRYLISECYILGWCGLSVIFLLISSSLPIWFVIGLMLRPIGILNKEIGVVLFDSNKITKNGVSHFSRVILLAFVNYVTAGLIFAILYTKVGQYISDANKVISHLPIKDAIAQSFSILFTFSPSYQPADVYTRLYGLCESGFCFVFAILIITTFVNLIKIKSDE